MRFRLLALLLTCSLLLTAGGCNYLILLGYLIGGPPAIAPDYETQTGKSLTDKDVVVAVACFAPKEVQYSFSHVDRELQKLVAQRLHMHKIKVINPDAVRRWLDENPHWDEPSEIGRGVQATHVVYIDLTNYTLFEENSHELYRGRAEGVVSVYEVGEDGDGEATYTKDILSKYPLLDAPRSTSDSSKVGFQTEYLHRLSEEVGRLFYEHYNGDDISDAA